MSIKTVCVLGGTGFVGRHIVRLLCAQGAAVRVATRSQNKARKTLRSLTAEIVVADVHDPAQLSKLLDGIGTVINLVGILHEEGRETFQRAHVELAIKLIDAARLAKVGRFLQMSALNAAPGALSAYLRTKGEAEVRVRASGLDATIFCPSVIFGAGDSFLSLFARLAKWAPAIPLACVDAKFQPVWVEDVAQVLVRSLNDPASVGQRYELCGPHVYRLRELVAFAAACRGRHPAIVPLPKSLGYLQASIMELLPVKLMTRDNFFSMQQDSICNCAFPFGITPASVEDIAPRHLL